MRTLDQGSSELIKNKWVFDKLRSDTSDSLWDCLALRPDQVIRGIDKQIKFIEEWIWGLDKYAILSDFLNEAKRLWIDVSMHEAKSDDYKKKAICNEVNIIAGLIKDWGSKSNKKNKWWWQSDYYALWHYIEKAKELWLDVSKIESELEELNKRAFHNDFEHFFDAIMSSFENGERLNTHEYETIDYAIGKLQELGENVLLYKEKLSSLFIERAKHYADIILQSKQNFEAFWELWYTEDLYYFDEYIKYAEQYWADVSELKAMSEKVQRKDIQDRINYCFSMLEKSFNNITYQALQNYIKEAERLWVDVTWYKDKLKTIAQ